MPIYDCRKLLQRVLQTVPVAHPGPAHVNTGARFHHGLLHGRYYKDPDRLLWGTKDIQEETAAKGRGRQQHNVAKPEVDILRQRLPEVDILRQRLSNGPGVL